MNQMNYNEPSRLLELLLTLIYILDEINVYLTTLWGFNFQSVDPQ